MKENNFNPGLKESNNFPKNSTQLKKKNHKTDTMNEGQHKQEMAELEYTYFNYCKDYTIRMFQVIEMLKICVWIK